MKPWVLIAIPGDDVAIRPEDVAFVRARTANERVRSLESFETCVGLRSGQNLMLKTPWDDVIELFVTGIATAQQEGGY